MDVSLGFFFILILVLFPGLLIRRLFFYGEFSKEFKGEFNVVSLLAVVTIPGLINLIFIFFFYDYFFTEIDLGAIIDKFKSINSPSFKFVESDDPSLMSLIKGEVGKFLSFLYLSSLLIGITSGRLIRVLGLDAKFKLLRFKNYWFYILNGQHTKFRKMKHLNIPGRKLLMTNVDVLIETNVENQLFSGIVVDYELLDNKCKVLSKLMLQSTRRYSEKNGKKVPVTIPGEIFVVDCTNMRSINFTYVYEEATSILKTKLPRYIDIFFSILSLLMIPVFLFKAKIITLDYYQEIFELAWYKKVVFYFLTLQIIQIVNPFVKVRDEESVEYRIVNYKDIAVKLIWIALMTLLFWIIY